MRQTARLIASNLEQFAPVTNHYGCSDGTYLLVTVDGLTDQMWERAAPIFSIIPLKDSVRSDSVVFRSDVQARIVGDGIPVHCSPYREGETHGEVLASLGYEVLHDGD